MYIIVPGGLGMKYEKAPDPRIQTLENQTQIDKHLTDTIKGRVRAIPPPDAAELRDLSALVAKLVLYTSIDSARGLVQNMVQYYQCHHACPTCDCNTEPRGWQSWH